MRTRALVAFAVVAALAVSSGCVRRPTLREEAGPYPANGQSLERTDADSQACVDYAFANSPRVNTVTNGALNGVKAGGPVGALVGVIVGPLQGDPSPDAETTAARGRGSANYHTVSEARRSAYTTCMMARGYVVRGQLAN